jgi:SpoVK/Ycf46/Vps4 family AAA+-type ATPase
VQLEFVEEEKQKRSLVVKPGVWAITSSSSGLTLKTTELTQDKLLDSFLHTKEVTGKIDCFFDNLHVYKEFGIEVPTRKMLLFGPAGVGKSALINKVSRKYVEQNNVAIIIWRTDKHDPYDVKQMFKDFKYQGVDRLIVIAEDLGGVEVDQVRIKSESSLLSLLDNQEKAMTIPTFILITTNYPENFLANLMNRPQRIDDKIEIGYPPAEARLELFKFFARPGQEVSQDALQLVASKKCSEFTPAHIKEVFLRSAIYSRPLEDTLGDMIKEIEHYKNAFSKRKPLGMGRQLDD